MKKPHVLNRSMFNKSGASAYGRGITSNLVSDEQRQRFNYGGRVGFQPDNPARYIPWRDAWSEWIKPGLKTIASVGKSSVHPFYGDVLGRTPEGMEDVIYEDPLAEAKFKRGRKDIVEEQIQEMKESSPGHPSQFEEVEEIKKSQILPPEPGVLPTDTDSDVLGVEAGTDWETFAEKLYDKKSAKGEAQLGLAGNVLAAAFQPKKEAMAILGKGLGEFGKTATARKKKMEDIAATGKMYETIYKTRAEEKGKQDRLTALNKTKTGNPWTDFQAASLALKDTDDAIAFATGETVINLTIDKETKQPKMPTGASPGKIFKHPTTKQYYVIDKDGKPQPINLNKYLKNLKLA